MHCFILAFVHVCMCVHACMLARMYVYVCVCCGNHLLKAANSLFKAVTLDNKYLSMLQRSPGGACLQVVQLEAVT